MTEMNTTRRQRLMNLLRGTVTNRLLLALLGVSLIPLVVLGVAAYFVTSNALMRSEEEKLEVVRTIKARYLEAAFQEIQRHLITISETLGVQDRVHKRSGLWWLGLRHGCERGVLRQPVCAHLRIIQRCFS